MNIESVTLTFKRFFTHKFIQHSNGDYANIINRFVSVILPLRVHEQVLSITNTEIQYVTDNCLYHVSGGYAIIKPHENVSHEITITCGDSFSYSIIKNCKTNKYKLLQIDKVDLSTKLLNEDTGELLEGRMYNLIRTNEIHVELLKFVNKGFPELGQWIIDNYVEKIKSRKFEFNTELTP